MKSAQGEMKIRTGNDMRSAQETKTNRTQGTRSRSAQRTKAIRTRNEIKTRSGNEMNSNIRNGTDTHRE
jgi:hypothetical protein